MGDMTAPITVFIIVFILGILNYRVKKYIELVHRTQRNVDELQDRIRKYVALKHGIAIDPATGGPFRSMEPTEFVTLPAALVVELKSILARSANHLREQVNLPTTADVRRTTANDASRLLQRLKDETHV